MTKNERETLNKYLNKKFPQVFYLDGNEEIVFFDSVVAGLCSRLLSFSKIKNVKIPLIDEEINQILDNNINEDGVVEYKLLLLKTVNIIEEYVKK